jgi:hypothetical protein
MLDAAWLQNAATCGDPRKQMPEHERAFQQALQLSPGGAPSPRGGAAFWAEVEKTQAAFAARDSASVRRIRPTKTDVITTGA